MKTPRIAVSLAMACAFLAASEGLAAQESSPFDYSFGIRSWGANLGIGYKGIALVPGLATALRADAGGGYEDYAYWRDAAGGILSSPDAAQLEDGPYKNLNFEWDIGIEQGLARGGPAGKDLVSAFAYYKGRSDDRLSDPKREQSVFASGRSDAKGDIVNSLIAGLRLDSRVRKAITGVQSGLWAEASLEWGPAPLSMAGNDYLRLNANAMGFLPLFEIARGDMNALSAYAGNFSSLDYATGKSVPMFVASSFGGSNAVYRAGLGDALRGIDRYRYDTNFKFVNNFELRFNGPSIILPNLYPVLVVFSDIGYFAQTGEGVARPASGWRFSLGAELRVNALDRVFPGLGMAYCLNDTSGGERSSLYITFALKFK